MIKKITTMMDTNTGITLIITSHNNQGRGEN
jgi:hypothetical protein